MKNTKILFWEKEDSKIGFLKESAIILVSSFLLGLFGKVSIPLPFTPVPIGTQNHLSFLLGAFLGPRRAALAVLAFLVQGAAGFPVFVGGKAGLGILFGIRAGYFVGYFVGAIVVGWMIQKMKEKGRWHVFSAFLVGSLAPYVFGAAYLSFFLGVKQALLLGVAPFILGDILKSAVCAKIVGTYQRLILKR